MGGRSINTCVFSGNAGKEPEVTYLQSGMAVASWSLALSQSRKVAGDKWESYTEWLQCKAFGKTAETAGQYLEKGALHIVRGKLTVERWKDRQTGADRQKTVIVVDELVLGPKKAGPPGAAAGGKSSAPAGKKQQSAGDDVPNDDLPSDGFIDDDLPFMRLEPPGIWW